MKNCLALLFCLFSAFTFAQQDQRIQNSKWAFYGEEFYTALASGQKMERPLFNKILNNFHTSIVGKFDVMAQNCTKSGQCYRQVSVGYESARKIMFGELDKQQDHNGTFIVDVYCGRKVYFKIDELSGMHENVNIEHTWPQSRFNGSFNKELQKSDMHHLYLTDSQANSYRGNNPFGFISRPEDRSKETGCSTSRHGLIDSREVYTPPVPHRGNVARALFYFSMHYQLPIDSDQERILRLWHKEDPIDAAEIKRHELITKYQKNRNPFIDHPEVVDRVSDF